MNTTKSENILKKAGAHFIGINKKAYIENYRGEKFPYKKYTIKDFSLGDLTFK